MSKKLCVFFLSVLVFLLAVSSAMATSLETIQVNDEGNPDYYIYADGELTIKKNATYTFADPQVVLNTIDLSAVKEVVITLPSPGTANPGYGTTGNFEIIWPTGLSETKKAKVTIEEGDVHSSVIADDINWEVPAYVDFTLNAPIRVRTDTPTINLTVAVKEKGKMTFGESGRIYGNSSNEFVTTGFIPGSGNSGTYTVDGTMEIQNKYAIIGSALTATVNKTGELILNTGSSELNLKGITAKDGNKETRESNDGAVIYVDGGTISVPSDLTLFGQIHSSTGMVKKGGKGTLTLSQSSSWPKPALADDIKDLQVLKGGLVLNGKPSWNASDDGVKVTASNDATFTANAKSIFEEGESFAIVVNGTATATFTQHSIYKGNEIYPYDDFVNNDNGLVIKVEGVTASVAKNAKLVIDNGAFPVENITGSGTVQINNSDPTKDKSVLILSDPDVDTSKFTGTITGSANLGLYYTNVEAIKAGTAFTNKSLFPKATVKFDNVIVYGPAVLKVDEKAKFSNVSAIWLRGNRPGAKNSEPEIANSKITVGGLRFANVNENYIDVNAEPVSSNDSEIDLTKVNIKIDGTSSGEGRATITLDRQVEAKIANITFYANRDLDFGGSYVKPAAGIYALTIDGSTQPSRLVIDGTTVTGDGLKADFANKEKVYQVQITDGSEVKFTGANGDDYYPLAKNNSLYVGKDVKLEVARGAILGGHVTFGGSTGDIPDSYPEDDEDDEDDEYPKDEWFAPLVEKGEVTSKWNDPALDNYSTFTTQVGKYNRVTNNYGEYAVKVTGDLTLSFDKTKAADDEAYPGKIVVRTKTDMDAFAGFLEDSKKFTTVGELFKVLGTDTGKYTKDFVTTKNMFGFRIPSANADPQGVTVGVREELAIVEFGQCSFVRGGEEFGQGAGHNFEIKAPVRIIIMGEEATISSETISGTTYYYLTNGTGKYYLDGKPEVYFRKYEDGLETAMENVLDANSWEATTLVRDNITLQATFELADSDGKPYVRLIGTSYSRDDPVNVSLALSIKGTNKEYSYNTLKLGGVIPAYTTYTFVRDGAPSPETGLQWSTAHTYAEELSETDFTVGEGTASFVVEGVRKATYNTNAAPVLVNGRYIWDVNADSGAYYMPDANGKDVRVTNLVVKRFDGNYLSKNTKSGDIKIDGATVTVTPSDNGVIVSVPAEKLGDTGGKFVVEKGLSLFGQRVNDKGEVTGEIITVPVAYMLHSKVDGEAIPADTLDNTVTIGGDSVSAYYDVDPNDLTGDLHFIGYGLPSWLGFSEHDGGFGYTTGDLTGVAPGTYNFQVLAYSGEGDNESSHAHKLYTFTVTVEGTTGPAITANPVVVEKGKTATLTLTVSGGEEDTMRTFAITALGTAPTNIFDKATGINILGNGTAQIKITAGQTEAVYSYYVSGGGLSTEFTVTVREPDPASVTIEEVDSNFGDALDGYTVRAVFSATANNFEGEVPEIEFEYVPANNLKSELYAFESKDEEGNKLFIVEGIAGRNGDNEQTFKVNAKAGNVEAEEPAEIEFTVEEDPYAEDVKYPNTTGISFDGESTAVANGYTAKFPANVTAGEDDVVLPSWLKPTLNDDDEVIGVEFVGYPLGDLDNGAKATVRIYAYDNSDNLDEDDTGDRYYGWDVVYAAKPKDLSVALSPSTLSLKVGETATATATASEAQGPVTFALSKDEAISWVTIDPATGVVTATNPTTAGDFTVTVVAQDSRGKEGQATADLTITVGVTPLIVSADPASVTFDSPTATAQTVTLSSNKTGTTFTAEVTTGSASGLTADVIGSTLTLTPSAEGTYTVTVTGTYRDTNGTETKTATVNVTVNKPDPDPDPDPENEPKVSVSQTSVTFASSTADAQTVTLSSTMTGTTTYTASVSPSTGLSADVSGSTLTLTPSKEGTYTVTVTGTNGTETKTATVNVTVSSDPTPPTPSKGGGGCDAGFGALALVLATPLFLRRRRS